MRNTHFMRIKFSELSKKDILPVAVNIFMRLKKAFTRLVRELICPIPIIIILKQYISGVKIRAGQWRFPDRFLFCPVEIFPEFTKTSGSLRQNIFGKIYCILLNDLIQKQIFVMSCNHTSHQQLFSKRHISYAQDRYALCLNPIRRVLS